jgi:multidrug efflux pump subunit AcrB
MIGTVMQAGIVKKNAIMMVDFALERRRVGLSAEHASEAALLPFRPIMMTTFAAIFGTLPIVRLALGCAGPRHRSCRRSLRIAAFDAVHHGGDLYLSRPD